MSLPRIVAPETLDNLAAEDPIAMRSRRDLRRVHRVMRTVPIVNRALRAMDVLRRPGPLRILELGAGDGTLLLRVARTFGQVAASVELTLLDRIALVDEAAIRAYAQVGWRANVEVADVLDWANDAAGTSPTTSPATRWDLIVANLFLHHFDGERLALILNAAAACGNRVFACEPRRAQIALVAAHLTGLIGANAVTREDAVLSVHAGFRRQELSDAWSSSRRSDWQLREYPAGLFSHCFYACRAGMP